MTKKQNVWLQHVAKVKKYNPNLSYKEILLKAKETYKNKMKGGALPLMPTGIRPVMKLPTKVSNPVLRFE